MNRRHMVGGPTRDQDSGFTLVELLVVVLIIGILVGISIPLYKRAQNHTKLKACYSNQRFIEGAASIWAAQNSGNLPALQGVVGQSHQLVLTMILRRPPRCPSAPTPASLDDPDASTGAYALDASGTVQPCPFGGHGYYGD